MSELLTVAGMRDLEAAAMASGAVAGLDLMERAGAGVVGAILAEWPEYARGAPSAVVLCGPGNNGGDGFVVARLLAGLGWSVEVFLHGRADQFGPDARANVERWSGPVAGFDAAGGGRRPDVLVDAVFGIGVSRPIPDAVAAAFAAVRARPGTAPMRTVAVDCPSGFDLDRGIFLSAPGSAEKGGARPPQADLCVTFHRPKPGHVLSEAAGRVLWVADIGLGEGFSTAAGQLIARQPAPGALRLVTPRLDEDSTLADWYRHVAGPEAGAHKYDRGHVLVLAGGVGQGGAARMAARAALRVGAGLVTLGVPQAAVFENAGRLDAVMLRTVVESYDLRRMLTDERLRCVVLGPGLGRNRAQDLVPAALWAKRATVLDADALTAFEDDPQLLFNHLHEAAILTPHEGEFRRLFPDLSLAPDGPGRIEAVRQAADRAGCTVLLKGPATVIARPDGCASIHPALRDRAVPWLATAGAGDVLAGMIGGLMAARPVDRLDVVFCAELGVWLHAEAARAFGPGLIAEDLPDALPGVLRAVGL
ncbi:NAD(P)H-hydrate dehydratase [Salipiger sp.]|uniref:NAD(P)H-hydrate dehydratase n=1 Tax=Salipiger sp. TaxID=2078585 RepID=UPI003A97514A